jgi:hypothetical protein
MRRAWFIALLCTLLLSLQQQALVHPLSHVAAPSNKAVVGAGHVDAPCIECALLSGGSNAAYARIAALAPDAPPQHAVFHSYRSRAGEVPAWFQSRAPPLLLTTHRT